jgi:two-component system, OmpR family, response regulator
MQLAMRSGMVAVRSKSSSSNMMRRKEQVLTRALLLEEVWNYKFVLRTNLVDVHLGRLRRKVDEPHELLMIHNVRGMGFILRAPA